MDLLLVLWKCVEVEFEYYNDDTAPEACRNNIGSKKEHFTYSKYSTYLSNASGYTYTATAPLLWISIVVVLVFERTYVECKMR